MADRRVDLPDIDMDPSLTPPSFATYTSSLTSSVAPSPSLLPQHIEPPNIARGVLNNDTLVSQPPRPVSASVAVDAALVAGSASVLIGIGCLLGFICYQRKRHRKGTTDFMAKSRAMRVSRKARDDDDDVEASTKSLRQPSDTEANEDQTSEAFCGSHINDLSSSAQVGFNHFSSFQLSTTVASFVTPLAMYANQYPQDSPALSMISTLCPRALETSQGDSHFSYTPKRSSVADPAERQEDDLGSVVLRTLQINETFGIIEPYGDHFATSRSVFPTSKDLTSEYGLFLDSSCNLTTSMGEDDFLEDATSSQTPHSSPTLSFDTQSLVTSGSPTLTTMQSLAIPDSPTLSSSAHSILSVLRYDSTLAFHSHPAEYAKLPPRLLELKLDSEVDLRSCLGLDRDGARLAGISECDATDPDSPEIPDLVPTDSQETVTGSDESYDHNSFGGSPISSYGYESQQEYEHHEKQICPTGEHCFAELATPVFTRAVTKSLFLCPIATSPQTVTTFLATDNQPQARTLSPSPSFASSSTSVTTLQLPSYCAAGQSSLVEEVLPPPSIIVSVPTDGSLVPESYGSALFSVMGFATGKEEQRVNSNRLKRCSVDATKVIYDPIDEVEEEAWGEAYERTCFVEASDSHGALALAMEESYRGFPESWMASSESSELDIEEAIARFPLPPIYSHTLKEAVESSTK